MTFTASPSHNVTIQIAALFSGLDFSLQVSKFCFESESESALDLNLPISNSVAIFLIEELKRKKATK